jgi:HSP20 family molecular chaperone IbpA
VIGSPWKASTAPKEAPCRNFLSSTSEFSYGSFVRSVTLPPGADEDSIKAAYDKGILTVTVPVSEVKPAEKHVTIESAK